MTTMASPSKKLPDLGTPVTRTTRRPLERASQTHIGRANVPDGVDDSGRLAQAVATATSRGFRLTWRMAALVGVLVVLLFSYATSLRVYFGQQSQLAALQAQIQANEQAIESYKDQLARWQDPAYVKAQARERLGWVVPGEVGFQVIGADGKPIGGGASVTGDALPQGEQGGTWWSRLMGSVAAADSPVPVTPTQQTPITVNSTPSPSPTDTPS